ncbi:MAG: RsmD family RNA methyltransferase [Pseudomonadota bacterium]
MRISGGAARGIPLQVPKGDAVRPATDGLRQAVFSSVAARVAGARFLDLFAGSGAYGLEALSRGAAGGIVVEKNAKAAGCLHRNLAAVCKSLGRGLEHLEIRQMDALTAPLDANGRPPEIVFVDPPYEIIAEVSPRLFVRLAELLVAQPDALVVFEMPGELTLSPPGWTCLKRLGKGIRQPTVCFFQKPSVLPGTDA